MADKENIYAAGFPLCFVAFLLLLIVAKNAGSVVAGVFAALFAVATITFLVLFLNQQPKSTTTVTPLATPTTSPPPSSEPSPKPYHDYKGDVHDVIDVEGIGPKYAEKLRAAGIETTARLTWAGPDEAARICDVPKKTAEKWIAMSQLIKVNGIGKQYAEALVRGGVLTIEDLKRGDPDVLAGRVTNYLESLESSVLGQKVTARRVKGWQQKAASMRRIPMRIPEA